MVIGRGQHGTRLAREIWQGVTTVANDSRLDVQIATAR